MKKIPAKAQSESYKVGYRHPPKKFQFRRGRSGNPSGKRKRGSSPPDLGAQLERALNEPVTLHQKTLTKAAAGMEQLVDQFAKGNPRARRDVIFLCEKFGINLTNRDALQSTLDDALCAEDEALLAEFVRRYGGQYPPRAHTVLSLTAKEANLLGPPNKAGKLLAAPAKVSTEIKPEEKSDE